uniref:hypothetical protein n=1 Tax=Spirosoma endbachense TaxID=2666025 RepID=UPI001E45D57A|nr:hypothetical protein [Spirosoma endbachense]
MYRQLCKTESTTTKNSSLVFNFPAACRKITASAAWFYRRLKETLDLTFLYEHTKDLNGSTEKKTPGTDYPMGTPLAMDISFKFNNEIPPRDGSEPNESFFGGNRPEQFEASRHFAELWTTFARTDKPAAKVVPQRPVYNLKPRPTMRIGVNCEVIDNRFGDELALWRSRGELKSKLAEGFSLRAVPRFKTVARLSTKSLILQFFDTTWPKASSAEGSISRSIWPYIA